MNLSRNISVVRMIGVNRPESERVAVSGDGNENYCEKAYTHENNRFLLIFCHAENFCLVLQMLSLSRTKDIYFYSLLPTKASYMIDR